MWKVLLVLLIFLVPTVALAVPKICTTPAGAVDFGPIAVVNPVASCAGGGVPDGDDIIVIPDGSDVTVIADILFTGDGSGIICETGGSLTIDAVSLDAGVGIEFFDGQDAEPLAEGQVAFYAEPGCELNFSGGFRQWGPVAPVAVATHTADNQTEWVVDQITPCDNQGDADIDCTSDADLLCLYWRKIRNFNASTAGETEGNHHINTAFQAVDDGDQACFIGDSAEAPQCYPIASSSCGGAQNCSMCLDVRQQAWNRSYGVEDSVEKPAALRDIHQDPNGILADVAAGDKCVYVHDNYIAADGDYVGRWLRPESPLVFQGEVAQEGYGDPYPYRIVKTYNDTDCDGTTPAAGDAIWLGSPIRKSIIVATEEDVTIDYGIAQGDTFLVIAPVSLSVDESVLDQEGKFIIQSTDANLSQVFVGGTGELRFDAAAGNLSCLHIKDSGDTATGQAALRFESMGSPEIDCLTILDGDIADGGAFQLLFDSTTGTAKVTNAGFRYSGSDNVSSTNTATGDLLIAQKIKAEYIGVSAATIVNNVISNYRATGFDRVEVNNLGCFNCLVDDAGQFGGIFLSDNDQAMVVDNVIAWGLLAGSVAADNSSTYNELLSVSNLWVEGVEVTKASGFSFVPQTTNHCLINDVTMTSGGAPAAAASILEETYTSDIRNCQFSNISTKDMIPFHVGSRFENVILWNIHTTYGGANCTAAAACYVTDITEPNTEDSWEIFERVTIGWDEGTTTIFNAGVHMTADAGHANENSFRFGAVQVYNLNNNLMTAGTVYSEDIIDGVLDVADYSEGSHCSHTLYASAGAAYVDFDDVDHYLEASLRRGWSPRFVNPEGGDYGIAVGSKAASDNCGAFTGLRTPGIRRNGSTWMYQSVGVTPPLQGVRTSFPWSN